MSKRDYGHFYEHEYRQLRPRSEGKLNHKENLDKTFKRMRLLGREIAYKVRSHINSGLTIEIGSSIGGILKGFQDIIGGDVIGIEPSTEESGFAEAAGVKTYVSLFEDFKENIPPADNILIVRSFNHLLDPKQFLTWANLNLKENGHLIILVLDFLKVCSRKGCIYTQIDHPFMFHSRVLKAFVESAGFKVDLLTSPKAGYLFLIGEKLNTQPFTNVYFSKNNYQKTKSSLGWLRVKAGHVFYRLRSILEKWKIKASQYVKINIWIKK
ncbi:MAG: hypothetical protein HYT03_01005 [Candidatus Harrisonbacteria bacterium]|nr:hypothetical protein [Candidatus Harrisonbacteria bacterium]